MASRTTTDPIEILLEVGIDLDNLSGEEDYLSALMEAVAIIELLTKGKGDKRSAILRKEVIRVRKSRKERDKNFKARKTTVSASSFKKGTASAGRKKSLSPGIEPQILLLPSGSFDEKEEKKAAKTKKATGGKQKDLLQGIAKSVSNIADIMKKQYALKKKKGAYDRKRAEAEKRKLKESNLEKSFKGLSSAAEKIIKPVKGILDKILEFFLKIIVGRFLVKFIGWIGDPKNKKKVDSVVRFLVDHGPKLLAAFLLFGTSIGRFAVRLSGVLIKGALRLGAAAAKFAIGFARRHPAAAAITAIVGGAAIAGAMNKKDDADDSEEKSTKNVTSLYAGGLVPSYAEGGKAGPEDADTSKIPKTDKENLLANLFGMTPTGMALKGAKSVGKGASSFGSSVKEKGLGNAAMDLAGGAFGNLKGFMDEKGITDVLMMHPLAKIAAFGFGKGKEAFGNLKGFADEKGITDLMMSHPLAKMGAFGLDKFMNFGKDPARDITGQSGQDIKGAGADTQLISARPGDFVVNKKTATAMGPDYFDAISTSTGEKVSGAGPDSQMIAVRPGEIVVNRETVDALGADHFLSLNRLFGGGGANKPKMANVQAASGGGFVLPAFSSGGQVGSYNNHRGAGAGSPNKGYVDERGEASGFKGLKDFKERYIAGDKSLLNRLAHGDTKGALKTLGIKIDNNTEAVDKNTDQRRKDSKDSKNYQQRIKQFIDNRKKELESAGPGIAEFIKNIGGPLTSENELSKAAAKTYDEEEIVKGKYNPLYNIGEHLTNISKKSYFGEDAIDKLTKERIASGELGEDGLGLTKTTQKNLDEHDAYIRSLYDPEKDTGFMGGLKKMNQTIQNKGAILDPLAALGLKEEGTEKFIEKITGGRVKNFGAKLTGLQMAAKGLAGPLGRMFQIDDRGSLGRYLRPAMEYAQSQGHTSVGTEAPGFGQKKYDELVGDKFANLALGQVHFEVDEQGRAKTSDVFDASRMTPKQYLEKSRKALGDAGNMLMGKEVLDAKGNVVQGGPVGIAKALYQSAFMGLSGRLATAQNTGFGNLRPMGLDIDLGGGFTPKKTPESEEKKQSTMNMIMGGKDAYYSSTTGKYYKNYAEALKDPKVAAAAKVEETKASLSFPTPSMTMPGPPPGGGNNVKVVRVPSSEQKSTDKQGGGGSDVDASPTGNGNKAKWNIFGIPMPF